MDAKLDSFYWVHSDSNCLESFILMSIVKSCLLYSISHNLPLTWTYCTRRMNWTNKHTLQDWYAHNYWLSSQCRPVFHLCWCFCLISIFSLCPLFLSPFLLPSLPSFPLFIPDFGWYYSALASFYYICTIGPSSLSPSLLPTTIPGCSLAGFRLKLRENIQAWNSPERVLNTYLLFHFQDETRVLILKNPVCPDGSLTRDGTISSTF